MPTIKQAFLGRPEASPRGEDFERKLYLCRLAGLGVANEDECRRFVEARWFRRCGWSLPAASPWAGLHRALTQAVRDVMGTGLGGDGHRALTARGLALARTLRRYERAVTDACLGHGINLSCDTMAEAEVGAEADGVASGIDAKAYRQNLSEVLGMEVTSDDVSAFGLDAGLDTRVGVYAYDMMSRFARHCRETGWHMGTPWRLGRWFR
jgi:hypothetical protein